MLPRSEILETSQVVVTLADRLARRTGEAARPAAPIAFPGSAGEQAWLIRRTLEELGIHCEEAAVLQDLAGFLMASDRGVEIVTAADLAPADRAQVYAQLIAQALLEPSNQPLLVRFEYLAGRGPSHRSAREVRDHRVAEAVARAILQGRLEGAPKLLYQGLPETTSGSLRRTAANLVLRALHRTSVMLYWRSRRYQRVRAWPLTSNVITKVEEILGRPWAVAS